MSDFDLSSFLAEQASGGVAHGEGDFTISHEKAAKKMAEYSLPREYAWVLKLVQAGVGWGCDSIKLTQTRLHSTLFFKMANSRDLPTNQELVKAILRADLESTKPLDAFALGLRLIVEKSYLSFQLLINTEDVEPQAIYAGVYFGELDESERAARRAGWGNGVTVMIHHVPHTDENRLLLNYVPVMKYGLPMIEELENYAFTCPVPFTVDGRRIDGVFKSKRFRWSGDFKPLRSVGLEIPGDEDPPFAMSPGFDNRVFSVYTPSTVRRRLDTAVMSESFYLLAAFSERDVVNVRDPEQNTLFWVRDGVIVDHSPLPRVTKFLRLYVFANATGLRADLTGFQLIRDEALTQRAERVIHRVAAAMYLEKQANRDVLKQTAAIVDMEGEQLADLPPLAQRMTEKLRGVESALQKDDDPKLDRYRKFAQRMVKGAYKVLQVAVTEPDYWSRTPFQLSYPDELGRLVKTLDKDEIGEKVAEKSTTPKGLFRPTP